MNSLAFEHSWPRVRVSFGRGAVRGCADLAAEHGIGAVALIADPAAREIADLVASDLGPAMAVRVDEVQMHVATTLVEATAARVRAAAADGIISIGGGSATGLAKGIAKVSGLPIIAVPTTYAGSEMSSIWGLTDDGVKSTGRLEQVRPVAAVYDADLSDSLPVELAVTSGLNSMAHSIEALYSPGQSPLGMLLAEEAVRSMSHALLGLVEGADHRAARDAALLGAWLGGCSLEVSTMGLHHRVCHVLGGLLDLPHAPLHSVVLPHAIGLNADAPGLAPALERALPAPETPSEATAPGRALWTLGRRLGAPSNLEQIGMLRSDLEAAADAVVESVAKSPPANPREVSAGETRDLVRAAFEGTAPGDGHGP